ncbi:ABC transporter, partial [Carbonactinospora thermoautotrophica]
MNGNDLAIRAEGLTKRFGSTEALRGLDLHAEAGTVLAVLGPNGAGKTTAVRILTTLLKPDSGCAEIAGFDVVRDAAKLRAHIGLTGQYAAVDEHLTGRENLELIGRLYHLGRRDAQRRAAWLLERFDLTDAAGRLVKTYSGGMRRRLDLAASLVMAPPVLILDEPTTGLDPRSRLAVWEVVEELVTAGTTVLLTTQYLEEADRLATRIAVVDGGRVIAEGTSDELKARVGGERLEITLEAGDDTSKAAEVLAAHGHGEIHLARARNSLSVPVSDGARRLAEIVRDLDAAGVHVVDFGVRRPTLDDVFLTLTGHTTAGETEEDEGRE